MPATGSALDSPRVPKGSGVVQVGPGLGCFLLLLSVVPATAASEPAPAPPERVRISYSLGADCPPPTAFEAQLDERLGSAWKAAPDELARTVTITTTAGENGTGLQMEYEDGAGHAVSRSVNAATCSEALALMAVITAVAVDAQLREPAPSAAPTTPATPATAAPAPPVVAKAAQRPAPQPASERPREAAFVHEAGLRVGVTSGFGSRVAFGLGAEWGLVGQNGFAVRVAVEGHNTGGVPASDGRARFRALTGQSVLCVATLSLTSRLGVPLCAGLEAGVLSAEGVIAPPAVTFEESSVVPWVAAVLSPRLRLTGGRLFMELVPELRFPLVGHTFLFENPTRTAYEIPPVAFGAALTVGVRFR